MQFIANDHFSLFIRLKRFVEVIETNSINSRLILHNAINKRKNIFITNLIILKVKTMKMIKTLVAATLITMFAIGSAQALTVKDVTSSTNVRITVNNGVATLFGNVESSFDRDLVARQAKKIDGVERVNNLLTFSN